MKGRIVQSSPSIIIPALNEAHHLAELLPQIHAQTLRPREILVADAGSTDATREVATACGARLVRGGRPAAGRNSGAREAASDWLCFIDADTRLPAADLLARVMAEAERSCLSALVCDYRPYYRPGDRGFDRWPLRLWDRLMLRAVSDAQRVSARFGFPVGQAVFLATRSEVFGRLGGFDEEAEPFEDSAYLLKVHQGCSCPPGRRSAVGVMPSSCFVHVSTRRYDVLGRLVFPSSMVVRGALVRWAGRRERPDHGYWDVNRLELYRERRSNGPGDGGDHSPDPGRRC